MKKIKVQIKREKGCEDIPLPTYMTDHSVGMDLYAAVEEETFLKPGERKLISTGISISLPVGYEAQIRPRSGLALKYGISVLNTPGTIDPDYRGVVKVIMINQGDKVFSIDRGDRIAQMVINKISIAQLEEVDELSLSKRNSGGFGHTGR